MLAAPATLPNYDRQDWKHWTDADEDCQNARNEVLIAESRAAVDFRTDRKCRVAAGEWLVPYSNTIVTDPSKLDVDHMVPLGNAHDSGAWQWSANRREQYANYLEYPQHFVTASANRSKGARGPDQWKPKDRSYWCQYATDWITIKDTWDLTTTRAEHDALAQMLDSCENRPHVVGRRTEPGREPARHNGHADPTDRNTNVEQPRLQRRCTGSRCNPRTGQQKRRQGLPCVDGTQRQRRRRHRMRTIGPTRSEQTGPIRTKRHTNRQRSLAARHLIVLTFSATVGFQHYIFGRGTSDD